MRLFLNKFPFGLTRISHETDQAFPHHESIQGGQKKKDRLQIDSASYSALGTIRAANSRLHISAAHRRDTFVVPDPAMHTTMSDQTILPVEPKIPTSRKKCGLMAMIFIAWMCHAWNVHAEIGQLAEVGPSDQPFKKILDDPVSFSGPRDQKNIG